MVLFNKRNIHGTKTELWKIKIMITGRKKNDFQKIKLDKPQKNLEIELI